MKINRIFQWLCLCFLMFPVFFFVSSGAAAAASPFVPVAYPGATTTVACAINDSGQVVGYTENWASAFLYDGTNYNPVPAPDGITVTGMVATAINNSGQVAGDYAQNGPWHGYISTSHQTEAIPDPPGSTNTFVWGINDFGQVVGTYSDGLGSHGFIYNGGDISTFDFPGASTGETFVNGINNNHQICGEYLNVLGDHGFVYNLSNGSSITIDIPGAASVEAWGINDIGQVSGTYKITGVGIYGFVYDLSTRTFTTIFQYPGYSSTTVRGINNKGQVVGFYQSGAQFYGFTAPVPAYTFTSFDCPGTYLSPTAINAIGQVVGTYYNSIWHGFLYTGSACTTLDYSTNTPTHPNGINVNGVVAGYYSGVGFSHGFMYSSTGDFSQLDLGVTPAPTFDVINGINDNGQITGSYIDSSNHYHGFVGTSGSFNSIDISAGSLNGIAGVAINSNEQVAGNYTDTNNIEHAFLYDNGSVTTISIQAATNGTHANAINSSGQIAGYYADNADKPHGFMYSAGGVTAVDYPGDTGTTIYGIDDSGQLAGNYSDSMGNSYGFVYNGGVFALLKYPGATASKVWAINSDGQLAGNYTDTTGNAHGFVATPLPPKPYTYYQDQDGDGYGDPGAPLQSYLETPPQGYVRDNTDCNDTDATIFPGAAPVCGQDKGCTGTTYGTNGTGPECAFVTGAGLTPPTVSAIPGQPMWMTASFTFTNNSNSTVWVMRPDCYNTLFTLTDQTTGKVPPDIERIRTPYLIPNDAVSIAPGSQTTFDVKCNVTDMYPAGSLAGAYKVQATYSNWAKDPDYDATTTPPTGYAMWSGAVTASATSSPIVAVSGSQIKVLPGILSFDKTTWYVNWGTHIGPVITATLTLAPGVSLPTGDTFDKATVTLDGLPADSSQPVTGGLTAQFSGTAAVNNLGTVSPGQTVYPEVEAVLSSGDVVRASRQITISPLCYQFSGFSAPVTDAGTGVVNTVKAGQTIPIKWLLTDCNGNGISDPGAFTLSASQSSACSDNSVTNDLTSVDLTSAGSSGTQYLGDGYWQFNWKTSKTDAGKCRNVKIQLNDGETPASANFWFRK